MGIWNGSDGWTAAAGLGKTAAVYGLLSLLQRLLNRVHLFKRAALALNLACLFGTALFFLGPQLAAIHSNVCKAFQAATIYFAACFALIMLDGLIFDLLLARRQGAKPVPVVLRDIGRWLLALVVLMLIVHTLFPRVNLNILAFSSIVVGYIVGNATQDTLGNLIAGLALNTETPFEIGDWVTVGGHTGRVVDMTWRATRLCTKTNDHIVIPNAVISKEPITNFSRPTRVHGHRFQVGVSYLAPPQHVQAVVLRVLRSVPGVLADPPCQVDLLSYGDSSITYSVKIFVNDFQHLEKIESDIMVRLWYGFKREGIAIPFPIRDVNLRTITPADEAAQAAARRAEVMAHLRQVALFEALTPDEIELLAGQVRPQIFTAGEALVVQDAEGDHLCVLVEGEVEVTVKDGAAGSPAVLARLRPPEFFGEMSLLTGARRTATVTAQTDVKVLEVTKTSLAPLLQHDAHLAERLARILEQRARERDGKLAELRAGTAAQKPPSVGVLLQHIRAFFGLIT